MSSNANFNTITAIYVRVSTTKESQKDSPEHQEGICREKARQLSLVVPESNIYEDKDSGTNIINRPAIQQLIKDAQDRKFFIVIFASLSRFSRDTMDSLMLKRTLVDSLGVRLISLDEGYDSLIDGDELKFQIISAVNQKMSEQISLSSKRGIRQSALKGNFIGSIPPYGYKKIQIDDRKTLVFDENTIETVRLIFNLYTLNNMGEKKITTFLNNKEIPSPKGGQWGVTTIQRILQNEAYTGTNVFGKYESKTVYKDISNLSDRRKKLVQRKQEDWERAHVVQTHEAIIDKDTFLLTKEIRLRRSGGKRGGSRTKKNVLAGIIKCAHCNSAMVSMKSRGGQLNSLGQEYRYLFCSKRRRQGETGCVNSFWLPYHPFKNDLIETISNKVADITSSEALFEKFKGLIEVENTGEKPQIKIMEQRILNTRKMLFELRKEKMSSNIDENQYNYEKQQYDRELTQLEQRLDEIKNNVAKKDNLQLLYGQIKGALDDLISLNFDDEDEFDELRNILMKLIELITVDKDGNITVKTTFGLHL